MPERIYDFATVSEYLFDPSKIELVAGEARLVYRIPPDATFHANYDVSADGNWGAGVLTGTLGGGAVVSNGKLDLTGGTVKYVDYDAALNADSTVAGCIRFTVTPGYSGAPAANSLFIRLSKAVTDSANLIFIYHNTAGGLILFMIDYAGAMLATVDYGNWIVVAGQDYELEFNWDLATGEARMFIDGIQMGATTAISGVRDSNIGAIRIGTSSGATYVADFKFDYLVIYSTVQHTADYLPGSPEINAPYATDNPTIIPVTSIDADSLESFIDTVAVAGGDEVRYAIQTNGTDKYWDGAQMSPSTGFAETNTAAELTANIGDIVSDSSNVVPVIYLHASDGKTYPAITNLAISYNFYGGAASALNKCTVWGYYYDDRGEAVSGATIRAILTAPTFYAETLLRQESISTVSRADGYWELELINTASMAPGAEWIFEFLHVDRLVYTTSINVPDVTSAKLSELVVT